MRMCPSIMKSIAVFGLLLLIVGGLNLAQAADEAMKVGKRGTVTLTKDFAIGDQTLKAGKYVVQHREHDSGHMMHFVPFGRPDAELAVDVKCEMQPSGKKWSRNAVVAKTEGGVDKITKIGLKGENVAYVFE